MRHPPKHIPRDHVSKFVKYDPLTGHVTTTKPTARLAEGHVFSARYPNTYVLVSVAGEQYLAHRLAWVLMTGTQPFIVDHKNGAKHDNRWTNLRDGDYAQNNRNRRSHREARGEFANADGT